MNIHVHGAPTPAELAALLVVLDSTASPGAPASPTEPTAPPFPRRARRRTHPARWLTPAGTAPTRRETA